MKRLTHTPQGFIKYMQMSRRGLFMFVEGKQSDIFFYSAICSPVCSRRNIQYEIIHAAEMSGTGGGKEQLVKFFKILQQSNELVSEFNGKKTTVLFFLDKDIDDLLNSAIKSTHVVYTPTYDVEGLIFQHGNLVRASAALAGLDSQRLDQEITDQETWLRTCAECWKEWIVICILCKKHKIRRCANFGAFSQVNQGNIGNPTGPLDPGRLTALLGKVQAGTSFNAVQFNRKHRCARRLVESLFSKKRHEIVFKGKWYVPFLRESLSNAAAGQNYDKKAVDAGIVGALNSTIDFSAAWARHFSEAADKVLAYIQ